MEDWDGFGDPWGGLGWVGVPSGRSGMGLVTFKKVRDWSGDSRIDQGGV